MTKAVNFAVEESANADSTVQIRPAVALEAEASALRRENALLRRRLGDMHRAVATPPRSSSSTAPKSSRPNSAMGHHRSASSGQGRVSRNRAGPVISPAYFENSEGPPPLEPVAFSQPQSTYRGGFATQRYPSTEGRARSRSPSPQSMMAASGRQAFSAEKPLRARCSSADGRGSSTARGAGSSCRAALLQHALDQPWPLSSHTTLRPPPPPQAARRSGGVLRGSGSKTRPKAP
eukprot:TRINITY_DN15856_c0_g3_i1.p1 TRINITY_DN15856_c0_g3~~TRINITY_DN15856_c0_g3_i1.p1  ORF type:complete len:249 (-),score=37.13 TRINITY_DN15856_c0_g3_i1:224-925(-)